MHRPRRFFASFVLVDALLQVLAACTAQAPVGGDPPRPIGDDPFGRGINFGNALEAPNEGD